VRAARLFCGSGFGYVHTRRKIIYEGKWLDPNKWWRGLIGFLVGVTQHVAWVCVNLPLTRGGGILASYSL